MHIAFAQPRPFAHQPAVFQPNRRGKFKPPADEKKFCITPVKGRAVEFAMSVNQGMRSQAILDAFFSELARKEKLIF